MIIFLFLLVMIPAVAADVVEQPVQVDDLQQAAEPVFDAVVAQQEQAEDDAVIRLDEEPTEEEVEEELELLDKIEAVVATTTEDKADSISVITMGDISRRGAFGGKTNVDNMVNEDLFNRVGEQFKIPVTDNDINLYLKKGGIPQDKIKEVSQMWGYLDLKDFYTDLKRLYRSGGVQNHLIQAELVIAEKDILSYYNNHPIMTEAVYLIETAIIERPVDQSADSFEQQVNEYIATRKNLAPVWNAPVELRETDLSSVNEFVRDMKRDDIHPRFTSVGVVLVRLKAFTPATVVPLEARRQEIVAALHADRSANALEKVTAKLRKEALILYPSEREYPPTTLADLQ